MRVPAPVRDFAYLLALTLSGVLLHGYHIGVDDQAMYLPAIKKLLNPELYPHDAIFFLAQTRFTLFDELIAFLVRASGLPLDWVLFLGYLLTAFLFLAGCLALSRRCFQTLAAQWAGVATVAAVWPLHATGTRVQLLDLCLHPRGLATAGLLLAICDVIDRRWRALLWLGLAALMHPQMAVLGAGHLAVLWILGSWTRRARLPAGSISPTVLLPLLLLVGDPTNLVWREIIQTRVHHYPLKWAWYEWLGVALPLVPLWFFTRAARRAGQALREQVAHSFLLSGSMGVSLAIVVTTVPAMEAFIPLQLMRVLHLVYIVFFVLLGGAMAECCLQGKPLRWAAYFVLLAAPVGIGYSFYYPASPHIEWPGRVPGNRWVEAFNWIRQNTPRDALFAHDPRQMERPGMDEHGFRAFAERSMMADYVKDRGVAALFPELAYAWREQVRDREGWRDFGPDDFRRLNREYGVTWVVLERPASPGLPCPFENESVLVCRID